MKITKPEDLKIGQWYSWCCQRDLGAIESQEEIDDIIERWEEGRSANVWDTKLEALQYIRDGWLGYDDEEVAICDEMIQEITKNWK